jgi:hypothetical protein
MRMLREEKIKLIQLKALPPILCPPLNQTIIILQAHVLHNPQNF